MLKRILGGVLLTTALSAIFLACVFAVGLKVALILWGIALFMVSLLIVACILLNE